MAEYTVNQDSFSFLLLDLREEFGQLFLFTLGGKRYVFRPLYLSEIESVSALAGKVPDFEVDEWVASRTFLGGERPRSYLFDDAPAGFIATIASHVMAKSHPGDIKAVTERLKQERDRLETDMGLFESTVLMGVGNILGDNYKRITAREQSRYLVLSEKVLKTEIALAEENTVKGKEGRKKRIKDPATAAMLSPESADKPDFDADNRQLRAL